jgi:two-component system sensor histidine kinase VanS
MKKSGIFVKVFIYTTLFSALLVGVATAILMQQLLSFRSQLRMQAITNSYNDSFDRLEDNGDTAQAFRIFDQSQSFEFCITDKSGNVVYKTRNADKSGIVADRFPDTTSNTIMLRLDREYNLHAFTDDIVGGNYSKWIMQAVFISAAMFAACIVGALFFARRITKPIKTLADATHKMANLEEALPLAERKDELGALARDVHSMYEKLKDEIVWERELEETQRYFFSAASHELKTPIAAASVLLEGMIANVGDYKDHPKYLRECVKLMDSQSKVISEILEIVNLSNGKIISAAEQIDVGCAVADVLPDFQILAEANGQSINVDIPEHQVCIADPKMLKKALSNVILNAVQNTPEGGKIRIWSEQSAGASRLRLCVLNLGVAIDEAVLPKLFDPFYRVDKARSRKSNRSGLGLTIVQKTLESMNIEFALKNTPDGVLFWLDLPKG